MDLDIQLTASAIVNFVDRCADMEFAQIKDKQTETSMEKLGIGDHLGALDPNNKLYTYNFMWDASVDCDFAFRVFKEIKARYSDEAHFVHFSMGILLTKSDNPGEGESLITMGLER